MTLSVGILRMSSDIRQGGSFVTITADLPRTQFIFLDELPEGPLYDLRSFFAGLTPTRFKDIFEDKTRAEALSSAHTAIVPLPGSSNPLSQIDQYDVPNCRYSGVVRTSRGGSCTTMAYCTRRVESAPPSSSRSPSLPARVDARSGTLIISFARST